ncbi:4Fe-4S dicluster domain-containing protein [Alkaliphilus serpentinus]|uniref:4Fe-4S dicluster domain-containing protein n=1 Tax=Alkaliphilus serpentinus TaxID=1482731 RepID=A0A833HN38_9FIRM|nr:4Fe-4S dicluster domain-containing protein [Alkaliphilus serpentinus]KAB3529037.1 4Fe-4S dicluster domain-containing protein [Alkaliphilus serpentinus]
MEETRPQKILQIKNLAQCIGCYSCMIACSTLVHRDFSLLKSAIRVKASGGYQGRVVIDICRGCQDGQCVEACPTNALTSRDGGGVLFHQDKCNGCKKCIDACLISAIAYDKDHKRAIPCLQCGLCVESCPHQVIKMEVR